MGDSRSTDSRPVRARSISGTNARTSRNARSPCRSRRRWRWHSSSALRRRSNTSTRTDVRTARARAMTSTDKSLTETTRTMDTSPAPPAGEPGANAGGAVDTAPAAAPARVSGRGSSLPLATRLLMFATGLIAVPLALAIGITTWRAQEVATQSVRDALEAAQATRVQFDAMRARQSELIARLVASDPAFVAD